MSANTIPAITCAPTDHSVASCGHCHAQNYVWETKAPAGEQVKPSGVALYDVRMPHNAHQVSVMTFCADCLRELSDAVHPFRSGR